MTMPVYFSEMPSPVGRLTLTSDGTHLTGVLFEEDARAVARSAWLRDDACLKAARLQLDEYFGGKRSAFDLRLAMGGTPFQRRVWQALTRIPFASTRSYGELARIVGAPKASRAVGAANGQNPIAIIVPCHRVIGSDGSLTGYGGGMPRKRWLLDLEQRVHARTTHAASMEAR